MTTIKSSGAPRRSEKLAIQAASEDTLLVISEISVAEGGITSDRVIIAGKVKGPVHARESLELQAQARVEGDISIRGTGDAPGGYHLGEVAASGIRRGLVRAE